MGRPRLATKKALSQPVMIRLTTEQRKVYEREARKEKMRLSGWIRVACDEKVKNTKEKAR